MSTWQSSSWSDFVTSAEPGSDDEDDIGDSESGTDVCTFLVDASPRMFVPNTASGSGETPMARALSIVAAFLHRKAITSWKDLTAVCFYNTEKTRNDHNFDKIFSFKVNDMAPLLDVASAEYVKAIERLRDDTDAFMQRIGSSQGASFDQALWVVSDTFASKKDSSVGSKRLIILTCDDLPTGDNPVSMTRARKRAQDLRDLGVAIWVMEFEPAGGSFDRSRFFNGLVVDPSDIMKASDFAADLANETLRKLVRKRAMQRIPWTIGPGMDLQVGFYALLREAKRPPAIKREKARNAELKVQSAYVDTRTGRLMAQTELKAAYEYGGEKVIFTREEIARIKQLQPPGMRLLGFKPRHCLKDKDNIRPSIFVYPDDETVRGSRLAFAALYRKMLDRNVFALCMVVPRAASSPRLAALLPSTGTGDEGEGFHLIWLPYADDRRHLAFDQEVKPSYEQVAAASSLVKSLKLESFSSLDFPNPALDHHYAAVEALALERDAPRPTTDYLVLDDAVAQKIKPKAEAFMKAAFPSGAPDAEAKPASRKRKDTAAAAAAAAAASEGDGGDGGGGEAKRPAVDLDEYRALAATPALDKRVVAELKDVLRAMGQPTTGRKDELLTRIRAYFNAHPK